MSGYSRLRSWNMIRCSRSRTQSQAATTRGERTRSSTRISSPKWAGAIRRTAVREQVDRTAFDDAEVIPARRGLKDRGAGQILPDLEHAAHGQQRVHRQIAEQADALEQQEPLHVELRSHGVGSGAP